MADDSIALSFEKNKVYAQSAYARRKLCRDAAIKYGYNPNELIKVASEEKDKFFVTVEKQFVKDPKVLAAIVVITENDAEKVTLKEVLGANKIRFVLDNLFKRNDFGANKLDQKEFKNCLEIVKKIPIYQLERPRNKMTVKEQVNVIKETV